MNQPPIAHPGEYAPLRPNAWLFIAARNNQVMNTIPVARYSTRYHPLTALSVPMASMASPNGPMDVLSAASSTAASATTVLSPTATARTTSAASKATRAWLSPTRESHRAGGGSGIGYAGGGGSGIGNAAGGGSGIGMTSSTGSMNGLLPAAVAPIPLPARQGNVKELPRRAAGTVRARAARHLERELAGRPPAQGRGLGGPVPTGRAVPPGDQVRRRRLSRAGLRQLGLRGGPLRGRAVERRGDRQQAPGERSAARLGGCRPRRRGPPPHG